MRQRCGGTGCAGAGKTAAIFRQVTKMSRPLTEHIIAWAASTEDRRARQRGDVQKVAEEQPGVDRPLGLLTSAPRRCYASLKWICDDTQQQQQNQDHNNDADDATNAISRSRCGAPIAIATAAIETTAIAKSAEQNDDDNNQHEGAHDSPPNAF